MAAPNIPNLLSLRGVTPHRRPLRGGYGPGASILDMRPEIMESPADKLIKETDNDASISRLSASSLGYLDDKFAAELVLKPNAPRRLPIINRGTYVRTTAIDRLVETFIASNEGLCMQIISMGAGTDTRYWRLREQDLHKGVLYHEIDFPSVSVGKLAAVRRSAVLSPKGSSFNCLNREAPDCNPEELTWGFFRDAPLNSQGYLFHPLDLRRPFRLGSMLSNVPTLLISECCLCYLKPEEAQAVIKYFTDIIPTIGIALYEPININSPFGTSMSANLAARGLIMPTVYAYPTLDKQMERLKDAGFSDAQNGADMLWLWKNWVSEAEKQRISGLEMLDELEEWELIASHYAVTWAYRELLPLGGHFLDWIHNCLGQYLYPKSLEWDGREDDEKTEVDETEVKHIIEMDE